MLRDPGPVQPGLRARRGARRRAAALGLVGVAALVLTACAPTVEGEAIAGAIPKMLVPAPDEAVSLRVEYEANPGEANEYWTEERQEKALPFDPIAPEEGGGAGVGDQATGVIVDPTTGAENPDGPQLPPSDAGDLFDATGLAAGTNGRLYMAFADGDSVCSATVVNSASRNVVATAAHCVWDMGNDTVADLVLFVPGDADNGRVQPFGVWEATGVILPDAFAQGAEEEDGHLAGDGWQYDFAFVTMGPNEQGQQIQDVVGGQGIAFGIPAEELVVIGYPTAEPFDGTSERFCAADAWTPMDYAYSLPCIMTPGASGGGWMTNYDPESGAGYLIATTSFSNTFELGAAPLGATALSLFDEIGGMP